MKPTGVKPSQPEIEAWLTQEIAEALGVEAREVDPDRSFLELGVSSRSVVGISGRLQKWLALKLPPTLLFEYPTVHELAAHLTGELGAKK